LSSCSLFGLASSSPFSRQCVLVLPFHPPDLFFVVIWFGSSKPIGQKLVSLIFRLCSLFAATVWVSYCFLVLWSVARWFVLCVLPSLLDPLLFLPSGFASSSCLLSYGPTDWSFVSELFVGLLVFGLLLLVLLSCLVLSFLCQFVALVALFCSLLCCAFVALLARLLSLKAQFCSRSLLRVFWFSVILNFVLWWEWKY